MFRFQRCAQGGLGYQVLQKLVSTEAQHIGPTQEQLLEGTEQGILQTEVQSHR